MKKYIFVFLFILSHQGHTKTDCGQMMRELFQRTEKTDFYHQRQYVLTTKAKKELNSLIESSKNRKELEDLLKSLKTSRFTRVTNLIKMRSHNIVDTLKYLDSINYNKMMFLNKILEGNKLTLKEKRAFYLLVRKRFWFEDKLFKNQVTNFYDNLSLLKFLQKKLDSLKYTTELDQFFREFNNGTFLENYFQKASLEQKTEKRLKEILNQDNTNDLNRNLEKIEKEILDLLKNSNSITKKYYQFRYDQIQVFKAVSNENEFDASAFVIKNKTFFSKIPNFVISTENLTKTLAAMIGITYAIDMAFYRIVTIREIEGPGFDELMDSAMMQEMNQDDEIDESELARELLEQQLNSGEISIEEYYQKSEELNL